jgi:hypothetical protein
MLVRAFRYILSGWHIITRGLGQCGSNLRADAYPKTLYVRSPNVKSDKVAIGNELNSAPLQYFTGPKRSQKL